MRDKSDFLYYLLIKKKNCLFYLCQEKDCQATVEPSGDDVPCLVIFIFGWHIKDTDLIKRHAEKLSGRKLHLEETSGFLLRLSSQSSQGNSSGQTRAKRCLFCHK